MSTLTTSARTRALELFLFCAMTSALLCSSNEVTEELVGQTGQSLVASGCAPAQRRLGTHGCNSR